MVKVTYYIFVGTSASFSLVPYSRKPVRKNKKPEDVFEIMNLNDPPRYLYPKGIINECGSAALAVIRSF